MSDFQRCLLRNFIVGLLASSLCFLCYYPMLSGMPDGHTPFAYALLTSSCTLTFSMGFAFFSSDHDPSLFKYLTDGARIALPLTLLSAFMGLFFFHWWGLGMGFVGGIWLSIAVVRLCGPAKLVDNENPQQNDLYSMVDYYSRGMRIPSAIIPPMALLGVFLFQWWGLGAGVICGGLFSTLGLALWGPSKHEEAILMPTELHTDVRIRLLDEQGKGREFLEATQLYDELITPPAPKRSATDCRIKFLDEEGKGREFLEATQLYGELIILTAPKHSAIDRRANSSKQGL